MSRWKNQLGDAVRPLSRCFEAAGRRSTLPSAVAQNVLSPDRARELRRTFSVCTVYTIFVYPFLEEQA